MAIDEKAKLEGKVEELKYALLELLAMTDNSALPPGLRETIKRAMLR